MFPVAGTGSSSIVFSFSFLEFIASAVSALCPHYQFTSMSMSVRSVSAHVIENHLILLIYSALSTLRQARTGLVWRGWCVTENHGVGGSIPPLGTTPKKCFWSMRTAETFVASSR